MSVDWTRTITDIEDKISRPLSAAEALDALEELVAELDVMVDALKDDVKREMRSDADGE
jgi:hypothetical protein